MGAKRKSGWKLTYFMILTLVTISSTSDATDQEENVNKGLPAKPRTFALTDTGRLTSAGLLVGLGAFIIGGLTLAKGNNARIGPSHSNLYDGPSPYVNPLKVLKAKLKPYFRPRRLYAEYFAKRRAERAKKRQSEKAKRRARTGKVRGSGRPRLNRQPKQYNPDGTISLRCNFSPALCKRHIKHRPVGLRPFHG